MNRRMARECAMQVLYQLDLGQTDTESAINHVLVEKEEETNPFFETLVYGFVDNKKNIDKLIRDNLTNWTLERIGSVDRAILRLAVYEMTQLADIPVNVTMNEAIEIAKIYGDNDSPGFINAVLSKVKDGLAK